MLTGGDDCILKVWDSEVQKSSPYFFQAFIGHTTGITQALFNPEDNAQVVSIAGQDGLFIWNFHGDLSVSDDIQHMDEPFTVQRSHSGRKGGKYSSIQDVEEEKLMFTGASHIQKSTKINRQNSTITKIDYNSTQTFAAIE